MSDKKKKIIIGLSIALVLIILIISIILITNNSNKQGEQIVSKEEIELSEVIDIEDIGKMKYETERTEEEISEKYLTGKEEYEIKGKVKAGKTEGKVIYVREDYEKINVYKTEYNLNKYTDKSMQIDNIIEGFETICKEYMEMTETEYEESEKVYGETEAKFELPIEESIYDEGRVYSKTYKNEEKEYDINYYRKDNKIVCEFVKIM